MFDREGLRLACVQGFGPAANLFGFLGLSEILVQRCNIGMQVRQQLSELRFLSNNVRFQGDLLFFTPPKALFETLDELNPTLHLPGIQLRSSGECFTVFKGLLCLIHPIDEDEKVPKSNFQGG